MIGNAETRMFELKVGIIKEKAECHYKQFNWRERNASKQSYLYFISIVLR